MTDDTLIFDTGEDIVGVYSVKQRKYTAYRGTNARDGSELLIRAREIVSYNGTRRDLYDLGKFLGLGDRKYPEILGLHTDMRVIIWSARIMGSSLIDTYKDHFDKLPEFPDTYEGSNWLDVHMTYKLWRCWKTGKLKMRDGQPVISKVFSPMKVSR